MGTVTFLLTDVGGSSRLWQDHPDEMASVIERHDELIRVAVDLHGGVFVKSRGEGDSTFSVFARSADAVAAAVDAQRALTAEGWPSGVEVSVRAALHSGEAQLRGGDYYGNVVNRCARLRDIAHAGQTICSQVTAELASESVMVGVSLLDLGSHRLRDLDRAQRVFQVCAPDLRDAFPSLRSLDSTPNNLPAQLSTFIGREHEIDVVRGMLEADRLVTLTGSGGCGKTRLALQVAAEVLDEYPDGVWWVDLAPIGDPELVPNAVGQAMGIRALPTEPLTATLERLLAQRRALVLLDNCEHVIEECAAVCHALLRSCPELVILATSREPLSVEGETTWSVPSLQTPIGSDGATPLSRYEAVRLFVDRAVRARPAFALSDENAPAIAQICRRLDGIPLAIELAASRIRVMSPDQIAAGLDDRFRMLGGGVRTAMPRQRTLEASVDWSYALLDEAQRILFRRLSVFAGSFALDSAEAVCSGGDLDVYRVFDVLLQLVDRSLVHIDEEPSPRYRLLETLRQYGHQKLAESGETDDVRRRHSDHFAALFANAQPLIEAGGTVEWLPRLRLELDNLRAALDWAEVSGHAREGLVLATAWYGYWAFCGHLEEGRERIRKLRSAFEPDPALLGRTLLTLMTIASRQGELARFHRYAESLARLMDDLDDRWLEARALCHGGGGVDAFTQTGDLGAMAMAWWDAMEVARVAGDDWALHTATNELGFHLMALGDIAHAREALQVSADESRAAGDLLNLEFALGLLGSCSFFSGHLDVGEAEIRESLALSASIGSGWFAPSMKAILGDLLAWRGGYAEARGLIDGMLREAIDWGLPQAEGTGWNSLARLEFALGDVEAAADAARRAVPVLRAVGHKVNSAQSLAILAWATAQRGDPDASEAGFEEALAEAGGGGARAFVLRMKAGTCRDRGDIDGCAQLALDGLAQGRTGAGVVSADLLEVLGGAVSLQPDHGQAARLFGAADAYRERVGAVRWRSQEAGFQDDVGRVLDALGQEAFTRAWDEGRALSVKDAVAYSMRGRGERKRPAIGWESLTPTELEVVRHVAGGLSNPQVAEKMFISRRTVTTHLTHIFAKVGVRSRTELAAEATRRDRKA